MSNSNPLVKFENVQKSYDGEVLVVKDFNLDVAKGEFVTMLGTVRLWKDDMPDDACWI
jgi:putative spermidine/putrescine transport system ATP-binding protein